MKGYLIMVKEDWSVHPAGGGTMIAEPRGYQQGNLASVMGAIGRCWQGSLQRLARPDMFYAGLVVVPAVLVHNSTPYSS